MPAPPPLRRSVWIDVFGVVLLGAVLLGGTGYVLVHVETAVPNVRRTAFQANDAPRRAPPAARRGPPAPSADRSFSLRDRGDPLFRPAPPRPRSPVEAPFSASWRAEATPDLAGGGTAAGEGSAVVTGRSAGSAGPSGATSGRPSPSLASPDRLSNGASRSDWTAEAQQFAGRARALSHQLGRMAQDPVDRSLGEAATPSSETAGGPSADGPLRATTNGNPPTPETPTIPIDDHVHWLLVAGLLWGVWRLARG